MNRMIPLNGRNGLPGFSLNNKITRYPSLGKRLLLFWDAQKGYLTHNSAFVALFAKLVSRAMGGLLDDKNDNNGQAVFNLIEGIALLVLFWLRLCADYGA